MEGFLKHNVKARTHEKNIFFFFLAKKTYQSKKNMKIQEKHICYIYIRKEANTLYETLQNKKEIFKHGQRA